MRHRRKNRGHLYHVTFYKNLGDIEQRGLRPGRGGGIGGAVYGTHRRGAIFLTDADGVFFWASRAEEWAQDRSDSVYDDGLAPVLLRVSDSIIKKCDIDDVGTRDAKADAYRCKTSVEPDDLEVWVGIDDKGKWKEIDDWGEIPYDEAFEFEEDEEQDLQWSYIRAGGGGSPLVPRL